MKVTSVYYKPLAEGFLSGVSPDKILHMMANDVVKRMRDKMRQTTFSDRAKKALARCIEFKVGPSSLTIIAKHPAFFPLVKGQKKEQMTWLKKAKRPIPIITETGELIFRWASPRSLANGKWVHPGRQPQDFIAQAKKESREYIRQRMAKELKRQIKAAWTKR